jgi:hypothetical protein
MANAQWPSNIPSSPLLSSYDEREDEDNLLRTEMEIGPAKVRPQQSSSIPKLSFDIMMTSAEVSLFKTFYRTTLSNGSLPFDFLHPQENVTLTFRFMPPYPRYKTASDQYLVAMNVEIIP